MKKTIIYTSACYFLLVTAILLGCDKIEENKEPSCDNNKNTSREIDYYGSNVVPKMVQSPTDDNIFTWYLDITDACPAGTYRLSYQLEIEHGQQTNVDISFASVVTGGGKSYYDFYPEGGVSESYYVFRGGTSSDKTTCADCDSKTPVELSASIQVKITGTGIVDFPDFISKYVKVVKITATYDQPGKE